MTASLVRKAGPFDDRPGFNRPVAEAVYGAIMKCDSDDEARMLSAVLLGEMLTHELVVHRQQIGKALADSFRARTVEIGKSLLSAAVVTARAGGDPTPALTGLEYLDEISKAGLTSDERAQHARRQKRDLLSGRFVQEHKDVLHLPGEKPLSQAEAHMLGIPEPETHKLTNQQRAQFQRGYKEVQDLIDRFSGLGPGDAAIHLHYAGGKSEVIPYPTGGLLRIKSKDPQDRAPGIDPTRKLTSVQLSVLPSTDLEGPGVQARFGAALGESGLLNNDTWDVSQGGSLADELTRSTPEEQYTPGARALRRAGSLAEAIHTSINNDRHPRLSLALKVGQKAGELGPEAQKVIGPAADRAAYRYRGTQRRTIDERLRNAISSFRGPGKREALIHGTEDDQGNWRSGAVLSYFRARLPRADLNTLQRKSGTIPPSEGVIIDRKGNAAVQAIGYADDHYLPFNLKNLAKLKGGEYVRTRTFGGPTTEDIYTGLIGGARSLTVVSHNGVYTMEFDDDLKGGRRFNDKAARMVARYGQLLDAVKSEQVTTGGIHPSRLAELEQTAGRIYDQDRDPEQYAAELDRLKTVERRRPQFSARQRQEASTEYLGELAARQRTADGHAMTAPELVDELISRNAREQMVRLQSAHGGVAGSLQQFKEAEAAKLNDPDPAVAARRVAAALGQERGLDTFLARREDEYKKGLTPLQLNSQGYELALTALQEQFPYYVKRIDFHPWTDAAGDAFDTGYVAPKHNRPAAALAGYFDRNILGHGKVRADSIRNQNYPVRRGKLDEVLAPKERAERKASARAGAPAGSHSEPTDPEVATHLRNESTMALINEIRGHQAFSSRASAAAIQNQPVTDWLDSMVGNGGAAKNLHHLLTVTEDDLQAELRDNPTKLRNTVAAALRENEQGGYFELDPTIRRNYANEGRYERPKAIDAQSAVKHLSDPAGTEYDIPGSVFNQDAQHSPREIEDAYASDPAISDDLRRDLGSLSDGHAFDAAAKDVRAELRRQYGQLLHWKSRRDQGFGAGREPFAEHEVQRNAEGLLHAIQLRRRHEQAVQRAVSVAAPSPITPSQDVVEIHHWREDDPNRPGTRVIEG